jgi:UDP-GlcNAc3NAcA epimerase
MKLITVVGARPQFIKASVVSMALADVCDEVIVHTGQHYDHNMSDVFFEELNIPKPAYNLGVGSGTHGKQTGEMLIKIEEVLLKEQPDALLVYGDTNSTLAVRWPLQNCIFRFCMWKPVCVLLTAVCLKKSTVF